MQGAADTPSSQPVVESPLVGRRLASLDAFRGGAMLLLVFFDGPHNGWWTPIVEAHPGRPALHAALGQFEHVPWAGLSLWDMIQPAFMFAVGASLHFSFAARIRRGQPFGQMLLHAAFRAFALILLGVFLRSASGDATNWTFDDVVTQIGLGYLFLFALAGRSWRVQLAAALAVLAVYWALFAFWPLPGPEYDYAAVHGQAYYDGFFAHWNKNAHPAHYFDQWLLNLFPRPEPFVASPGGYNTLNFIPSLATMIFGLLAGGVLAGARSPRRKIAFLVLGGTAGCLAGLALHYGGVCPIVKRIWTPSFALLTAGISAMLLALLYTVVDVAGRRRWAFPAIVVGQNSIAAYAMLHLLAGWLLAAMHRHLGAKSFAAFGDAYQPLLENLAVGACIWLVCLWMYRRKIFLRL